MEPNIIPADMPQLINVADLYKRLEEEGRKKGLNNNKAERIRAAVKDVAKSTGVTKLLFSAVFSIVKEKIDPRLERSYFANTVERAWVTVRENGRVWIDITQEKGRSR